MSIFPDLDRALRAIRAPQAFTREVLLQAGLRDAYVLLPSPLGEVYVAFNERGISFVAKATSDAAFEKQFAAQFNRRAVEASSVPPEISSAIGGDSKALRGLRFDLSGLSAFARAVLEKASEIPRGQVRPYGWIASEIGAPKAVRAVGTALAKNPVPLLIPCHRVVRSDGTIGDYALGSANKRRVLGSEGIELSEFARRARAGIRFIASEETHVYCYPLCSAAKRITDRHRMEFKSAHEAARSGMRPCKLCRPAAAA